eukprot:TRINITY_DN5683_c0_g1_i2.p1 TRINITY_DN5683_c0_g1~~TRINITY_DN5683_c0_g1_i2.p1  ORF type:complete len:371 (-),score=84.87 TRINITY_DN5683_c0_g1_i2:22-1134(-)
MSSIVYIPTNKWGWSVLTPEEHHQINVYRHKRNIEENIDYMYNCFSMQGKSDSGKKKGKRIKEKRRNKRDKYPDFCEVVDPLEELKRNRNPVRYEYKSKQKIVIPSTKKKLHNPLPKSKKERIPFKPFVIDEETSRQATQESLQKIRRYESNSLLNRQLVQKLNNWEYTNLINPPTLESTIQEYNEPAILHDTRNLSVLSGKDKVHSLDKVFEEEVFEETIEYDSEQSYDSALSTKSNLMVDLYTKLVGGNDADTMFDSLNSSLKVSYFKEDTIEKPCSYMLNEIDNSRKHDIYFDSVETSSTSYFIEEIPDRRSIYFEEQDEEKERSLHVSEVENITILDTQTGFIRTENGPCTIQIGRNEKVMSIKYK